MSIVNSILKAYLKRRISQIELFVKNPHDVQERIFRQLISQGRGTVWGNKHNYSSIRNLEDYRRNVPVSTYEQIYPYIEQTLKGQQNILWPTAINWFSKSSGTTNSKSKFIPVSSESLHDCHFKGGQDLLSLYFNNNPQSKLFAGKGLAIGGSYAVNPYNPQTHCGDVSAVIMKNLPAWAQYVRTPGLNIALMSEWEAKIEKIAEVTIKENVTNISAVPTWTIALLEKILQKTGKKNILEVWPNFEVFFHGAVSFTPYRDVFQKFLPSSSTYYVETYNASEGFFGIQDTLDNNEMLFMLDYGIYYEFIPMEEFGSDSPKAVSLSEVELNKNYAMVISTNAGLWRYLIGDTIRFTSKSPYRIKITGRTKHFINAFGEELIIENAENAIARACKETNSVITNFTAAPIYLNEKGKGGHEWVIEFSKEPKDMTLFTQLLDNYLKELNSDYEAKRYKSLVLQLPVVHSVNEGVFYAWMKKRGKVGGQNKVPRLSNTREYVDDILHDLAPASK